MVKKSEEAVDEALGAFGQRLKQTAADYELAKVVPTTIFSVAKNFYKIPNEVLRCFVFSGEFTLYQIRLYLFLFMEAYDERKPTGMTAPITKYRAAKVCGVHTSRVGDIFSSLVQINAIEFTGEEKTPVTKGRTRESYKKRYTVNVPINEKGRFVFVPPSQAYYINSSTEALPIESLESLETKKNPKGKKKSRSQYVNELLQLEYNKSFIDILNDTKNRIVLPGAELSGKDVIDAIVEIFHLPDDLTESSIELNEFQKKFAADNYPVLLSKVVDKIKQKFTR